MIKSCEAIIAVPQPHAEAGDRTDACIDLDRFCDGCGYNLRTLPVTRDAHTGIYVVRCTECGRYLPANGTSTALHPWLNRLTSLLLVSWIFTLITAFFFLGLGEGAISYATLDELTIHGGYQRRQVGNTTTFSWIRGYGPLEVQADYPFYKSFVTAILGGSFAIAFAGGMLAVVTLPHWRRGAYAAVVATIPIVAAAILVIGWRQEAPHLFHWSLPYVFAHAAVQILGGLTGIVGGRPLARLAVRIFLPPGARPRLAYLWLVDRKPLPQP